MAKAEGAAYISSIVQHARALAPADIQERSQYPTVQLDYENTYVMQGWITFPFYLICIFMTTIARSFSETKVPSPSPSSSKGTVHPPSFFFFYVSFVFCFFASASTSLLSAFSSSRGRFSTFLKKFEMDPFSLSTGTMKSGEFVPVGPTLSVT